MQAYGRAGAAVLLAAAGSAAAETTVEATLATDYVVRGVSQTLSEPALQAGVYAEHESGWSAYLWGSNVDLSAAGDPDDGAWVEFNAALQYERALSARVSASAGRVEYLYPGTRAGFDYDYGEWLGELALDGRHRLRFAWSEDIFGAGVPGWYVGAATSFELPAGLALELQAGHADLQRLCGESYLHGSVALSGTAGAFGWQVAAHATNASARRACYASTVEPRVVLTVTWSPW